MRTLIILIFSLSLIQGCESNKRTEDVTQLDKEISSTLSLMEIYADSAEMVYQKSIEYLKKNPDSISVLTLKKEYQASALRYYTILFNAIDNITQKYLRKELSQEDYDLFIEKSRAKMVGLKSKIKELKSLGLKFDLNNPPVQTDSIEMKRDER